MTNAQTTSNLRQEVADLNSTITDLVNLLDLEVPNIEFQDLVAIGDVLSNAGDLLSMVTKNIKQTANDRMKKAKVKSAIIVGIDGKQYVVEQVNTPTRTGVRKDDLLKDVERIASQSEDRLDKATGEMLPAEKILLEILKVAFRFEPRWSEITKLGLDDDEYCSKSWNSTIKVTQASTEVI